MTKISTRDALVSKISSLQKEGKKIVYTSGVFDLLHPGHIDTLRNAKNCGDTLVVGVNTDESVRSNKGPLRPINNTDSRLILLAALEVVDFVFSFDEKNNNKNIELLKPDVYVKAGDYKKEHLSSAPLVESYGGAVQIVPSLPGYSSSGIIDHILISHAAVKPHVADTVTMPCMPAIFVDRDGVINKEIEYLHKPEQFELIPGTLEALKKLSETGYRIVVVTNQAGIGLGYFSKEDFYKVNKGMLSEAHKVGLKIDRVYYCPHGIDDGCICRKPSPGMLLQAAQELNIDLKKSYMIGDKQTDIEAGEAAGCKGILVDRNTTLAESIGQIAAP
jgi:D-glycero-D-manno-heptose 1,7-bisphosphate phosphatase